MRPPPAASVRPRRQARLRWALAALVIGAGVVTSYAAWQEARSTERRERAAYFEYRVRDAVDRIAHRLAAYEQVLHGTKGLFEASASVERSEFAHYVATLQLEERFPGIQGVGFALAIPPAELAAHEAALRAEGFPAYAVRPRGERELYTSIIYLEPFRDRNLRAFGFDMYSEPVRRAAMEAARDLGDATLSRKVTLVQETEVAPQSGFLMYMPVYTQGVPVSSAAERRAAHRGWAYAPFRMGDFMAGVLGELGDDLDLEIYDGDEPVAETLMFRSHAEALPVGSERAARSLDFHGRRWTLAMHALPGLDARLGRGRSDVVGALGLALTLLVGGVTLALLRGREQAISRAAENEARVEQLMQQANDSILLMTLDGRIVDANPRAVEHFGHPLSALRGMSVSALHPPGDHGIAERLAQTRDEGSGRFEARHQHSDGGVLTSDVSARVVTLGAERLVLAVVRDVTQQKALEAELARVEREQRTILENANVGITFVKDRVQLWANRRMCELFGYDIGEMSGRSTRLFYASDEEYARFGVLAYPVLAAGTTFEAELPLRRKDGSTFWARLCGKAVDPNDAATGSIWTFEDVSTRKALELELERRRRELEVLNRGLEARIASAVDELRGKDRILIVQGRQAAMGEMIGNIAHQWRQPLNALALVLANVADASRLGELDEETLAALLSEGERIIQKMSATITDFRNFFRPDKEKRAFSALEQVRAAVALVAPTLAGDGIAVNVEAAGDVVLSGFPNEYSQVLLNLLVNAGQAIREQGRGGTITVTLREREGSGVVTVRDTGGGIPEAIVDRIFEPYFSTKPLGTGIGLYMSKMIVERSMGGRLAAENVPGGAAFEVVTPLAGAPA